MILLERPFFENELKKTIFLKTIVLFSFFVVVIITTRSFKK